MIAVDAANKYRQRIGQLLEAHKELMSIDKEYVAANVAGGLTDGDPGAEPPIPPDFPDITVLQFTEGVGAAQAVMATVEAQATNLYITSNGSQR